jgi:hypothetical protein
MDNKETLTKRFVVVSIFLLIVVTPFVAWLSATYLHKSNLTSDTTVSDQKIVDVINEYVKNSDFIGKVSLISSTKYEQNWYLVRVQDSQVAYDVVLCDFDQPRVIIGPGEYLTQFNISHMGVPYQILDALEVKDKENSGGDSHEHTEYDS